MNFFEQVSQSKHRIRLIVFHPLAVTESGAPDYARRSPYPAVLFVKEP